MQLGDYVLPIEERTCIMGVLNVTPDSFSDGGMYLDPDRAAQHAKNLAAEGADIIDIGGESSRPGAKSITPQEEIDRIMPVIRAVKALVSVPISVDTYKSEVARLALLEGASIVNDISGLKSDPKMASVIAELDAGVVLMHMKGTPKDMQSGPEYGNVIEEIYEYLSKSIDLAITAGIDKDKIIIDPGIGFGKTLEHNLLILKELEEFKKLKKPILIGTSRKSFIGKITGAEAGDRLMGTAASCALAIMNGANIIRVHNVSALRDVAKVVDAIKGA